MATLQDNIESGRRAGTLARELESYFAALRAETQREWAMSQPSDAEGRERLFYELRALTRLEQRISRAINAGKLAEREKDG
jgi:hypothetical protein